jgi:hypothetical protein
MTGRERSHALCALAVALLGVSPASAQLPLRLSVSGDGFSTNVNSEDQSGTQRLSGYSAGGDATLAFGRLGVSVRYLEGSLTPTGTATGRDLVEGEALLSVRALSWLSLKFGPHIRSFLFTGSTERWVFWEGRLRTHAHLGSERISSFFEFSQVLAADVNAAQPFDGGQGIEGALRWEISALPIWLGLGYRIDRSRLGDGARTEVVEHIVLSVGFGRGSEN